MAKLVLAAGVPHPPRLVYEMAQSPGKCGRSADEAGARASGKGEPD
jgi:hypothetical protein